MNPAKPQQPADGQRDDSEDLIAELARMMGTGAQGKQSQSSDAGKTAEPPAAAVAQPTSSGPTAPLRIPGQGSEPAAPPAGFRFDFNVPKTPAVTPPEPLVNWQERLKRGNAPASSVRLEPTLERVPVEPETPAPSFVAPPVSETRRAPEPEPEPEPEAIGAETAAADDEHDAIADLIAAELDAGIPHPAEEPAAPEEAPEPPPEQTLSRTNYTARPVPDEDRFASPPVFGVGTRAADVPPPPQEAPQADRPLDPMDEIESLIGAAIQNDPGIRQVVAPPSAAPAPSMASAAPAATDFAADDDDDAAHEAAEAAILAAAAATGVEVSRVAAESRFQAAAEMAEEPPRRVRRERPALRVPGFRPFIGPLVAGVFLVLAGLGLYWVLGMGHGDGTTAPVLTADSTPAKQAPATPSATTTPPAASAVFNELDGKVPTAADEQLVSRDQSTGTEVPPAAASTDEGDGLANRKVRTVTVRPDGTIVNADDALAGGEILPVERPNVPDVPDGNLDNSDLLTAAAQQPAATTPPANSGATAETATPGATPAANDEFANAPIDPNAPVPMPRPADRAALQQPSAQLASNGAANDLIGNLAAADATQQGQQPAAANNSQQQASTGGSSAPAYVQLSSQRDENVAQQSLVGINSRYGKLLKGILPEVQRVDLGSRGIYYRVRVPTDSLNSANYLCSQIKTAGGDCIVTN
jgi:hypothetical protein